MNPNYHGNTAPSIDLYLLTVVLIAFIPSTGITGENRDIAEMDLQSLLDNVVLSASKHEETLEETPPMYLSSQGI